MARQDAGTMFRSLPTTQTLGDYNGVSRVGPSTTFHATGSRAGAGFIIENVTNVLIHCASGGSLNGDQCISTFVTFSIINPAPALEPVA
jgi:hypothetical protein